MRNDIEYTTSGDLPEAGRQSTSLETFRGCSFPKVNGQHSGTSHLVDDPGHTNQDKGTSSSGEMMKTGDDRLKEHKPLSFDRKLQRLRERLGLGRPAGPLNWTRLELHVSDMIFLGCSAVEIRIPTYCINCS